MAAIRARKLVRRPLNRSRSGDGLLRARRSPKKRVSCLAVVVVFLLLVILVVVATVQTTSLSESGGIRKRQMQQFYRSHNSDEHIPSDSEEEEGGITDPRDNAEAEEAEAVEKEIDAAKAAMEARLEAEREEERLLEEREEEIRRERDQQLKELREEKERLERIIKEQEEQRLRAEEAAREATRLREEEERKREEELARKKKKEEDREAERLEALRREEERLREEEGQRRKQEEEERKQEAERLRQEEARKHQLEEEAKHQKHIPKTKTQRLREERQQLQKEQEAKQTAHTQTRNPQQKVLHLETPKNNNVATRLRAKETPKEQLPAQDGEIPEQATISFCEFMRKKPGTAEEHVDQYGFKNPAIIILGAEDTSTDLLWHVIEQILYPGRHNARKNHELELKQKAVDYTKLRQVQEYAIRDFWKNVPEKSKGKWLVHAFCQQQENDVAAGFPWLTSPNHITGNQKAKETLELIKQLPKGSLKIIRIKRNSLDVHIRHAQIEQGAHSSAPVKLDRKHIFQQLRAIEQEQKEVDKYLEENNIPHLTLDFETLFPFDEWPNLVEAYQSFSVNPSHINVDWRQLDSPLESNWRELLRFLHVYQPLSMFDILSNAMQTHEVTTFWLQKNAVEKFAYITTTLQGTHFFPLVRKPQEKPKFKKTQNFNDLWGEGDEM